MGVFQNAIIHEISQFSKHFGKNPKYLILSVDKEMLLAHECLVSEDYRIEKKFDAETGKKYKVFAGLEIVRVTVHYSGSIGWGLGD